MVVRTKSESAEQFSKRMHKDGRMTKQMKDELRAKHMKERDAYELANLGHFNRCYPSQDPHLQDKYDKIHQVSVMMWNDQNGTRPRDNSLVVNTPLY